MIRVKYKLDTSVIHGIGLFVDEDIKKGDVVYTSSPLLDLNLTQEQFDSLSEQEQKEVRWWGFFDTASNRWHVDFDVSKFINHFSEGNLTQDSAHTDAYLVAVRDIRKGEELTQNYLEFESENDLRARGILADTTSAK